MQWERDLALGEYRLYVFVIKKEVREIHRLAADPTGCTNHSHDGRDSREEGIHPNVEPGAQAKIFATGEKG